MAVLLDAQELARRDLDRRLADRLERNSVREQSGNRRLIVGQDPNAVAWWIVVRFPDGYVFARGGRCRTSKLARSLVFRARIKARMEHEEFVYRETP